MKFQPKLAAASTVSDDGKTYLKRVAGSPFSNPVNQTCRSCFLCGVHQVQSDLQTKKFVGRAEQICKDTVACKARRSKD